MDRVLCGLLQTALNRYVELDPEAATGLDPLLGKSLMVEVVGTGIRFCVTVQQRLFQVEPECPCEPSASVRGTLAAFARLGTQGDGARALFEGDVEVRGDTEVGNKLKSVLKAVEIDWEELLAQGVGDIAAHQIGNVARDLGDWISRARTSFDSDVNEYVHEEARLFPSRLEIEEFMDEVDTLRSDTDRLEARLKRLEQHLTDTSKH